MLNTSIRLLEVVVTDTPFPAERYLLGCFDCRLIRELMQVGTDVAVYHYSDSVIYGFSHTHLNGTGVSDYGDIMLMATMGESSLDPKQYSSKFSHKNETASAGFYSVKLDDDNISVRLTTTKRVGYHEYTFNKHGQANLILDLNHRDELLKGEVKIIDDKTIEILRQTKHGQPINMFLQGLSFQNR